MFGANAILPLFIDEVHLSEADVRDRDAMARELKDADVVIHLAAPGLPAVQEDAP